MPNKFNFTLDEMTTEWFTSVLILAGLLEGSSVASVELKPFGSGVMTNMVRAKLSYNNTCDAPASVLVKYPSNDEGNLGIAQLMGLYELEVRFYQDVVSQLTATSIPACYFAELDEKTGRFTLVLEDLSASTIPGTMLDVVSIDDCVAAFHALANFQAPLWNSPTFSQLTWLDPARTLHFYDAIPQYLEPFLDRFAHALDPGHIRLLETALPQAGKWVRSWSAPKVLSHGEFRTANILMGTSPAAAPVTIIDFQTVHVGSPGIDPAYFMGASMPTDARRKIERDVIFDYHQNLLRMGVEGFDWDACWKSYCECALYGIYLYGGTSSEVESTEQNNQLIIHMFRQLADMAIDLDALKIAGLS